MDPCRSGAEETLQDYKTSSLARTVSATKSNLPSFLLVCVCSFLIINSNTTPTTMALSATTTNNNNNSNKSSSHHERMDGTYDTLAKKLRSKLDELDKNNENIKVTSSKPKQRQYWVGVAGGPGSGKSTVARAVADRLNAGKTDDDDDLAIVVPMDGWHFPQKQLKELFGDDAMKRRGAPFTFDAEKCYQDLKRAKDDGSASFPIYDRKKSDPVEGGVHLKPTNRIVFVEGLYLLMPKIEEEKLTTSCDENDVGQGSPTIVDVDCDMRRRILYWWGRHKELFDEGWFIKAPSRDEQFDRLVQRNKETWNEEKDKMWGPWPEGARKRVETNDVKQMDLIAPSEQSADEVIVTR
jgi:pantothenate kinase